MNRNSTVHFLINTLASKNKLDILHLDPLLNIEEDDEFAEIYEYLNTLEMDVRDDVVMDILEVAKETQK